VEAEFSIDLMRRRVEDAYRYALDASSRSRESR
jgi:hypothetical protein